MNWLRGHIGLGKTLRWVLVLVGMMGLNGTSVGQDPWEDEWEWEITNWFTKGAVLMSSIEVLDFNQNVIISSDNIKPAEIKVSYKLRVEDESWVDMYEYISLSHLSGDFNNYCDEGSYENEHFGVEWSIQVNPQEFFDKSIIQSYVCLDDVLNFSIKNKGFEGNLYRFYISKGFNSKLVQETYMGDSYPVLDFQFEFSDSNIRDIFGLDSTDEIFGSYNFYVSVNTCSSLPEIREHWNGIQLIPRPPHVTDVKTLPPECPGGNDGEIVVEFEKIYPNTQFVFTIAQLRDISVGSVIDDWISDIDCNDPNVWCDGSHDLSDMDRGFIGSYSHEFETGDSNLVEIDTSKFSASGTTLNLSAGLYAMRIETKVGEQIYCDNQYFVVEIPEPEPMEGIILSDVGPSCYGGSDRNLEIKISGGSPPYTYMIGEGPSNDFESTFTLEGRSAETFSITINDNCGTPYTFDVPNIELPNYETTIENIEHPSCNDGSFSVITNYDGSSPLEYQIKYQGNEWGLIQDSDFFDELTPGLYTGSAIIDGCSYTSSVIQLDTPRFKDVNHAHWGQECSDDEYGAMIVSISSSADVSDTLSVSYRLEDTIANYVQTGLITNLDFPGSTMQHYEPVPPGRYHLTLDDNCSHINLYEGDFNIQLRFPVSINPISPVTIDCPNDDNGEITFEVNGGTTDYRFSLDGVSIQHQSLGGSWYKISSLGKGSHILEVTDACGISFDIEFSVLVENGAKDFTLNQFDIFKQISCPEKNDASIIIGVSGGTPFPASDKDYLVSLYNENHESFSPTTEGGGSEFYFTNLGPGNYYPVVKDNNGCEKPFVDDIIEILPPTEVQILEVTDTHFVPGQVKPDQDGNLMIRCHGDRVDFSPEPGTDYHGGTGELTTMLELKGVSVPFTNLGPGTYTFHVTDDNGCPSSKQFELREPEEALTALVTPLTYSHGKHIKCVEDDNGKITVSISGGIPPYDFEINGDTEAIDYFDGNWTFDSLTAELPQTSYTIVVTDYLGCQFEQVVNLEPPTKPRLDYFIVSEVVGEYEIPCTGASATIRFTGSGGDETNQYRLQVNGEIVGLFDPDGTLEKELTAGIYTINMLDNLGCYSDVFELDLTEPDEPLSFTTTAIHPNCIGGEDGSISIEVSGGVPSYHYSLDGISWQEENLFPGLEAGEYEVFVKDNNECTMSETIIVPDNPNPLTVTHTAINPPSCHHGTDGSITVQTTNFRLKEDNKLSYFISGGHYGDEVIEVVSEVDPLQEDHFMTFENLWDTKDPDFVAENYEIWVEDFYECMEMTNQFMGNLALEAPDPVRLGAEVTVPSCYNGENGWFVITAQGGVSPYEFSLDNASFEASNTSDNSSFIFPHLPSGDYMVYVRDANFQADQPTCLATLEVHVPRGMDMEVIERVQNISCVGGDDGAIEVDVETYYENFPFEYEDDRLSLEWFFGSNPLSEGSSLANLSKGVYTLKMSYDQDSLVCREQEDIAILGPNIPLSIASIKTYPTSCGEENDGRAIVNFTGGWTDSTTYYNLNDEGWTPILGSSIVIYGLSLGNHSIKIGQSAFNCLDESSFAIQASKINIDTVFIQAPACSDGSNGIVILKASNVAEPRFIIADSSYISTSGTYSGLSSGKTYDLVVFDEANPLCISDTISFSFPSCEDDTEDVVIAGVPVIQPATCETAEDGDAQVIATGGLPPYNYLLDGVVISNENLSNLMPGVHEIIVTDQLGKKDSATFIMDTEDGLSISTVSTSKSTCPGRCDGSATIVVEGGSGLNNVKWDDDFIGFERSDLCPGVYSFQVIDERNEACVLNGEVNISGYEPLAVEVIQLTKPTCPGGTNGKISVRGFGGSGSYSFEWGDGSIESGLVNISAGVYEVTLTDDLLNCSVVEEIELPDIPAILVSDTILGLPSCRGSADGSIELVLENAVSPLVEWDDGGIGLFRKNLSSGTYHFTVTASNSCQIAGEIVLPDRDPLSVEVSKTDNYCYGFCEGTIDLSISGGLAPYYIEWGSGLKSLHLNQLCNGVYDYQVVDRLGCVVEGSVEIRSPDPLAIELIEKNDVSCRGFGDGTLEVAATGGTGTYSYQWNSGNETQSIEGLQPGNYTVSVSDENGCLTNATYTITQPQSIFLKKETIVDPSCDGKNDGQIEVLAAGGNSSFQYTWDNLSTDPFIDGLYEGSYQLTIEDERGCNYTKTLTLEAPPPLSFVNTRSQDPICFDESSGLISTEVIGGTGPYAYSWNSGHTTSTVENLPHGEYELTVTDANGCAIASSFQLSNPGPLSIEGIEQLVTLCEGGSVFISPDGDWEKYSWHGPSGFSSVSPRIEASLPGAYTLSVENEDGCEVSQSFSIEWSESILDADFIRISEAVVNEPLIFVDLSLPVPDEVEWVLPESENIIVTSKDDQFIEVVFTEPGAYELGLVAYYQSCIAELFKTIEIEAGSGETSNARVAEIDAIYTSVYPNPSQGNLEVIVNVDTKDQLTVKLLDMTRDELIHENLSGKLDYLLRWDLTEVPSGVYFLVVQSGKNVQQKRILLVR
ncbi:MAG: T9SS type A sorting domain-containing protein [Cyclobacteriaceae bacterium]